MDSQAEYELRKIRLDAREAAASGVPYPLTHALATLSGVDTTVGMVTSVYIESKVGELARVTTTRLSCDGDGNPILDPGGNFKKTWTYSAFNDNPYSDG